MHRFLCWRHADWMQLKRAFSKGPSFPVAQLLYHCVLSTLSDQNEVFCPWLWNSYCFQPPFFEPSGEGNVNAGWSWWSIWNAGEAQQTLEIGGIWHLCLIYHEITFSHQVKWLEFIGMIKGKVVSLFFLKASLCLFLNPTAQVSSQRPWRLPTCESAECCSCQTFHAYFDSLSTYTLHDACMDPAINLSHSTHVFVEFH